MNFLERIIRVIPAGAKSFAPATTRFIATGSSRSKTQKLFRFGHFGIPFL
jgi:hypothetical protein